MHIPAVHDDIVVFTSHLNCKILAAGIQKIQEKEQVQVYLHRSTYLTTESWQKIVGYFEDFRSCTEDPR